MTRFVADLGNSRLKLGRIDESNSLLNVISLSVKNVDTWRDEIRSTISGAEGDAWAISSVNPPVETRLDQIIHEYSPERVVWYRSASEVGAPNRLSEPERAGADRALAVVAARSIVGAGRPIVVVLCGTAITIERIDRDGFWIGGAIAPGMRIVATALNIGAAKLPFVEPAIDLDHAQSPATLGLRTQDAIAAGVYWGTIGSINYMIDLQCENELDRPVVVASGGDARFFARRSQGRIDRVIPELTLIGLAKTAFDISIRSF